MNVNGNNNQGNGSGGGIGIFILIVFVLLCMGSCSQNDSYDDAFESGYHYYANN